MAIGDFNNGNSSNNTQKNTEATYYSRMKFKTKEGKRALNFTFWSGLMIIAIDDIDNSNGFRSNTIEVIRLSPNKAKILLKELYNLKEYMNSASKIDPNKAFGVSAGLGTEIPYIGFSISDNENKSLAVTIGKINNSGDIISAQTVVLDSTDYNYGLEWTDITKMNVEKAVYHHIELDMIMDALYDFSTHMNGALAYSVLDLGRYDTARMNRRFDSIFDKLGIEKFTPGQRNYGSGSGNNFLNNLAAKNSTSTSIDDLEEFLDD